MRLFLTSYQKSGTHQIMPALGILDDVIDKSWIDFTEIPRRYGTQRKVNTDGIRETCKALREFETKAFGHIPYVPEYAEALQAQPTKVLFNIRDPRDVVVANWYSINKVYYRTDPPGKKGYGHLNMYDHVEKEWLIHKVDPIADLIEIEAMRWKSWLGWLQHDFVMAVKFEDLRTNAVETLQRVSSFASPYVIDAEVTSGLLNPRHHNPTFRKGAIGDWKEEFTEYHKELSAELMSGTIKKLGYEIAGNK